MMNEVILRLVDMPATVKGFTVLDNNGDYNVYINPQYPVEMQRETALHELGHITANHFYSDLGIRDKEDLEVS